MIVLVHLLGALFVTALAESGARLDLLPTWTALLWPLGVYLVVARLRRRAARGVAQRLGPRLVMWWPILCQAAAVGLSDWLAVGTTDAPGLEGASVFAWPSWSLFALLAPFALGSLATSDALFGLRHAGTPVSWRADRTTRASERSAALGRAARSIVAVLAPLALFVAVSTPLRHHPDLRAYVEEVGALEILWTLAVGLAFAALLPRLFAVALGLVPIGRARGESPAAKRLAEVFDRVAERVGFRGRGPLLWRTGGDEINAAVVGFVAAHRYVLVTDGIVAGLREPQAEALFGHEMGHAARRHPALFAQFSLALLAPAVVLPELIGGDGWIVEWVVPLGLALVWFLGFGWLSRRAELEADLVAVECAGGARPLIELLRRTASSRTWRRNGWRHFSPAQRALFARSAERHTEVGLRLERTLARARAAARIGTLVALLALLVSTVRGWETDRARLALRHGDYAAAAHWASEAARGDGLAELARVGSTVERSVDAGPGGPGELGDGARGPAPSGAELIEAAASALDANDTVRAGLLLELARFRRGGGLDERGRAVEDRLWNARAGLPPDGAQ
ncbi:Protease HtpX [Planctomycetes bacterium Pla163]|uniref:Protease HtpX n=1 Tax=Rohdeia mirabilis TaxID=2528008 RepID=A0A518D538_9BACT|nr:Protease HtpX [Planctomycetes bacterium Pla163]